MIFKTEYVICCLLVIHWANIGEPYLHVRYAIKIKSVFSPWHKVSYNWILYTHGVILLHTLLVKYYYDYLDRQSSGRHRGWVTYLYVGGVFVIPLGSKLANFQQISHLTRAVKNRKKFYIEINLDIIEMEST